MNLVGKIFVVLVLLMSVIFAGFAVAVYATHRNWKLVVDNQDTGPGRPPLGLKQQLEQREQRLRELTDRRNELARLLEQEKSAYEQVRVKLENEKEELRRERDDRESKLADVTQAHREALAVVDASHKELARLRTEIDGLQASVLKFQRERDDHFTEVVRLTDELHAAVFELNQLKDTNRELLVELTEMKNKLRAAKIDPDAPMGLPVVEGLVMSILGDGLVEISIGSDDGLRQGHQLYVYRVGGGRSTYVGKVEVLRTNVDRSVGKIIEAQGNLARGDRVASQL